MYYTSRAKAEALRRAGEKFLYYDKLCYKIFRIQLDTLAFEGIDLLQTSKKYQRVSCRATAKRDFWRAEVERILHSK